MTDQSYPELQDPVILADGISFEDYLVQFEGQHTEWHFGKIVQKVSNNSRHQMILLFLSTLLSLYLSRQKIGKLLIAGFPMYISPDVPAREPDLMVVLNNKLDWIKSNYLEGSADIAIEIVSPESYNDDRVVKLFDYEKAGVTEYWLIDPIRKEASIYVLNDNGRYEHHAKDAERRLQSTVLKQFVLNPELIWQDNLPEGVEIIPLVQAMFD